MTAPSRRCPTYSCLAALVRRTPGMGCTHVMGTQNPPMSVAGFRLDKALSTPRSRCAFRARMSNRMWGGGHDSPGCRRCCRLAGMDGPMALKVALLALTFGFAFTIVGYADYANAKGWPVGEWFRDSTSFANVFGFLGVIAAPIVTLWILPWWAVIIVLVGGFVFGLIATNVLKARVQIVALAGLVVCWVTNIFYVLP